MKIETTEAHLISVPLKVKTWTAQESFSEMSCLLIEINTDSGLQGVGQVTGPNLSKVLDYVQQFGAIIKGMDARSSTVIWDKLFHLLHRVLMVRTLKTGYPHLCPERTGFRSLQLLEVSTMRFGTSKEKLPICQCLGYLEAKNPEFRSMRLAAI